MRMAELSRQSGVAVATIKYYQREGLLPPGELSRPNQASYGENHLRRLRLIRALIDLAQVPVAQVVVVLQALDSHSMSLHDRIGAVHRAVTPVRHYASDSGAYTAAATEVRELVERRGWAVEPDAPAISTLVATVAALRSLGQDHLVAFLDAYAQAVEQVTELEVAAVNSRNDPDQIAESVVIGTVLGETLISALRLLSQENVSARLLGGGRAGQASASSS